MSDNTNRRDARRPTGINPSDEAPTGKGIHGGSSFAWIGILWQDIRYATRLLRKNPGFTVVAVLTLALGVGANTAVFSVVNSVVLRPLPYKDSPRLVNVTTSTAMFPQFTMLGNSWVAYDQMRKNVSAFEQSAAYRTSNLTLTASGDPALLSVASAGEGFFELFGVIRQQGRLLVSSDQAQNQGRVAVLSDAFWRAHFGADRGVIGRVLALDKREYVVVGVASRGFDFPDRADLWVPLVMPKEEITNVTMFNVHVIAKLRRGTSVSQAQSQLNVIAQDIANANPPLKEGYGLRAVTILEGKVGNIRAAYLMLFGAASFVLLISCANLASLLLSRGFGRQREMAMRAALGASRGRIIRQALVESSLLGLLGGIAGAFLAAFGVDLFHQLATTYTPRIDEIGADATMFWFALGSSLFAGILFGLAPALRASKSDPNSALKEGVGGTVSGMSGTRQLKLGSLLVISEVALAFVLLIGAVVTAEGLAKLLKTETGMRTDHLLTFDLPLTEYTDNNADAVHAKINDILQRVRALPGVTDVTATDHNVLGGNMYLTSGFTVEGVAANSQAEHTANVRYTSPSYFQMLGVRLLRGRFFTEHDLPNSEKVMIVNEAMAQKLWGSVDVVGKRIGYGRNGGKDNKNWTTVAGVVADTREVALGSKPSPEFYFPILQGGPGSLHLIVRTAKDPAALATLISRQVWTADKDQPITKVATLDNLIRETIGDTRMHTVLLNVFGAIGLGLALLGVYGVVAYSVSRRTREIGIRMALGANPLDVMRMVIRQGLILAVIGVAIGAAGAVALKQVLQNNFTVANTNDIATYLVAGVLVIIVACFACYVPARRAMRVDPMIALRYE